MIKKYQIFISSTFRDLVDERRACIEAILDIEHIPSGMEVFPAADQEQFDYIKKVIDECDYYLLLIGARYGSVDADGISFTEREYEYAVRSGKFVLAFIHGDPGSIAVSKAEINPELVERLANFKKKVSTGRLVKSWTTTDTLKAGVIVSLTKAFSQFPATGWIRGDTAASQDLLEQTNRLRDQLEVLRSENESLRSALTPAIPEDAAQLSDTFPIRYNYVDEFRGRRRDSIGQKKLRWQDIFLAVGPSYYKPNNPLLIDRALMIYLKENYGEGSVTSVFSTDINTIKIHLGTIGLISVYQAEQVGGGVGEFCVLTNHGRKVLGEISTVRQKPSTQSSN